MAIQCNESDDVDEDKPNPKPKQCPHLFSIKKTKINRMSITVQKRDGTESFIGKWKRQNSIINVRQRVYTGITLPANVSRHNIVLTWNGIKLNDGCKLHDYNLSDGGIILWHTDMNIDPPKAKQPKTTSESHMAVEDARRLSTVAKPQTTFGDDRKDAAHDDNMPRHMSMEDAMNLLVHDKIDANEHKQNDMVMQRNESDDFHENKPKPKPKRCPHLTQIKNKINRFKNHRVKTIECHKCHGNGD
eukprot:152343_1